MVISIKSGFIREIAVKILCIGDSLIYGNVGYSYVPFLSKNIVTINKGLNGDTLWGVSNRLKKIFNNHANDFDFVILGIGTNDTLLPYLKKLDFYWKFQMSIRCKIKNCIEDDLEFLSKFETLMNVIISSGKKLL